MNRVIFLVEFNDGYSFRNLIEYLKETNTCSNFIFTPHTIQYRKSDANKTILNDFVLRKEDLPKYIYNSPDPEVVVGVRLADLRSLVRPIGKKDGLRIYMLEEEQNLYIQILGQESKSSSRENCSVLRVQNLSREIYDLDDYQRDIGSPNCTIPCVSFCKACQGMHAIKCTYATLEGLSDGLIIKGMTSGTTVGRREKFGTTESFEGGVGDVFNVTDNARESTAIERKLKIPSSTVRALAKLSNLNQGGTFKFYMEPELPIKIQTNIGNYGTLTVYLCESE